MNVTILELCVFIGTMAVFGIVLFFIYKRINTRIEGIRKLLWAASYYPDRVKAIKNNIDKSLKEIAKEYQGDSKIVS